MRRSTIITAGIFGIAAAGAGGWYYVDQRIRSEFDARLDALVASGQYESLHYDELSYSFDGSVAIEGLHVQQPGISYTLERVDVARLDYSGEIPLDLDIKVRGVRFPDGLPDLRGTDDEQLGALLARIATDDAIPLELDYSHRYQPDNAHQVDTAMTLRIPQLMHLDMSGRMRQVPLASVVELSDADVDPMLLQQQLLPLIADAEIPLLQLRLQDLGLVQAAVEQGAIDFNTTPDDYRNMLASQARNAYLFLPQSAQTLARDAGAHLASFMEGERTLHVSAQPQFEGKVGQLQVEIMGALLTGNFNRVVEVLNFELRTD